MNKNSAPMYGNHLAAISSDMFPRVMLSRIREKRTSTAVCTRLGRASIRRATKSTVKIVSSAAMIRYSTARLMLKTPRLTQLTSLNSFCGRNSWFMCVLMPKITASTIRPNT